MMPERSTVHLYWMISFQRGSTESLRSAILLFGLFGVRPLLHVLRVPRGILMPIVFLLCTVGAFASASRLFDVYAMLAIGIGAYFLRRRGYEMAPLVLGLVLGPLLDKSLRRRRKNASTPMNSIT